MKKTYIIANWKMNLSLEQAVGLLNSVLQINTQPNPSMHLVIAPGLIFLPTLAEIIAKSHSDIKLAAQNFFPQEQGAYTGETSITQVKPYVSYAIIGHSERRHLFQESDDFIRQKVIIAHQNKIKPIICIGETAKERDSGLTTKVLKKQLTNAFFNLPPEQIADSIIAYEPVWAISNQDNPNPATPELIAQTLDVITNIIQTDFHAQIPILYGGSVSSANIADIVACPNCSGTLIGSASLKIEQFSSIIDTINPIKV